jgi:hypothetical protein
LKRTPVLSSHIRSVGYDVEQQILEIEFMSTEIYQYLKVPEKEYKKMMSASSVGGFFQKHIIHNYKVRRVSTDGQ